VVALAAIFGLGRGPDVARAQTLPPSFASGRVDVDGVTLASFIGFRFSAVAPPGAPNSFRDIVVTRRVEGRTSATLLRSLAQRQSLGNVTITLLSATGETLNRYALTNPRVTQVVQSDQLRSGSGLLEDVSIGGAQHLTIDGVQVF
jgi:hypothetical protein